LLWKPNTIISKLLTWARRRPLDINVLYEYAVQSGRQEDVSMALINSVDEMLADGDDDTFYNLYVFQATRLVASFCGLTKGAITDTRFKGAVPFGERQEGK